MKNTRLEELLNAAKGDRTMKKYAEDAGVNPATVYRTINGDYKPGLKVLGNLANHADPNSGVTLEKLFVASKGNETVKEITSAGSKVATMALGTMAGLFVGLPMVAVPGMFGAVEGLKLIAGASSSKKNADSTKKEKAYDITTERIHALQKKNQQFSAIASGIVYSQLAQKGIRFRPGNKESLDYRLNEEDSVIFVEEEGIEEWVFSIVCMSDEDKELNGFIKKTAPNTFMRFFFLPENKKRKISIVVNDEELYKVFAGFKGSNCYRGNVSVILVDEKQVRIVKEEYIAYYDTENPESNLTVV